MTVKAVLVAAALLAAGVAVSAQTPSPAPTPRPLVIDVEVDVVSLTAVVLDKGGRFARGLTAKDIEVREDGVPQQVSHFREMSGAAPGERVPLTMVLVLDASGSMGKSMPFLKEAALSLIFKMEEQDRALIVEFNSGVKSSAEFSADLDRLERYVEALQAWGATSLNDAVHYALNRIKDEPGRKAVVVFSDGADTSSQMKEQEVLDYAKSVEATVYGIGFAGSGGITGRGPRGFLRRLVAETGGLYFSPDKVGELTKVFQAIANELANHYVLAYTPTRASDGSWRTIAVAAKQRDLEVRVRKGYFAVKRRGASRPR